MSVQIKFCGMMLTADVEAALDAGAGYVGAILAGGPRNLSRARALATLMPAVGRARRVCVVAPGEIGDVVANARGFDVVQLHGDVTPDFINALRSEFDGDVWAVVRSESGQLDSSIEDLYSASDAVVFDRKSLSGLGGTGERLDWKQLAESLASTRRGPTVLAGGLTPESVAEAIRIVGPDIVDVSSGVETSVGVKDHERVRAFAHAVRGVETG